VIIPYLGEAAEDAKTLPHAMTLEALLKPYAPRPVTFERLAFNHPAYIMFSSGTTGVPKCIVHGAGGTLLQHLKEQRLQCDLRDGDRLFYFTTCGWMMWNWLASGIASGATLILYDGSPFAPTPSVLWDYAQAERITLFGTSAKYIDACHKEGVEPARTHNLSSIKLITSTGSPLAPDSFDYVYRSIKSDVPLTSISGGTDIMGCFVLGDPTSPVWKGEIQAPGLGMAVDVWSEDGKPVRMRKGELVCTRPFVSMPIGFWNDPGGNKYRAAYFERFSNIWCHGDFAEWTAHGGMIIHGRSDATLNPGGVRIGTAESRPSSDRRSRSDCHWTRFGQRRTRVLFVRLKGVSSSMRRCATRLHQNQNRATRAVPAKILHGDIRDPSRAKSPSSPCATSCTGGRSKTPMRLPTRKRSRSTGTCRICGRRMG
jgi:acetoacetyl-CoA synthetase